ncbi:MAG: hypothetical protein RL885_03465 [Planctomycetota bacterium]
MKRDAASARHCCDAMKQHAESTCDLHPDRFDCPDALIHCSRPSGDYGIILHDDGRSVISIAYCPWCGVGLSGHSSKKPRPND